MASTDYLTDDFECLSAARRTLAGADLRHTTTEIRVRLRKAGEWLCADYVQSQGVWFVVTKPMTDKESVNHYRHYLPHRLSVTADAAAQLTQLADALINYRQFPSPPPTPEEVAVARYQRNWTPSPALGGYRSEGYLAAYDW